MLITTMRDRVARDGDHVIATCYGIADEVVMEALNLSNVSLYYLRPPPGALTPWRVTPYTSPEGILA